MAGLHSTPSCIFGLLKMGSRLLRKRKEKKVKTTCVAYQNHPLSTPKLPSELYQFPCRMCQRRTLSGSGVFND
jgi:hypothetical protein